jgi:thiamine-monophosphate kinase
LRGAAITVDPVIYRRHFDDRVPPQAVGAKLLKRNLSDLAAMGARPTAAVIALTLDPRTSMEWLGKFYHGLAAAARRYGVPIVGGDVAQADDVLSASLTLLGQAAGQRLVTRQGSRRGDWLYVTGSLGGSLLGHHHRFEPRLAEGAWLASRPEVRAMIDVSDGLAKDIHPLTPRNTRAALTASSIPVSKAAHRLAEKSGRTAIEHALCDGEDYELLFSVAGKSDRTAFERSWRRRFSTRLTCIGQWVPGPLPAGSLNLADYRGYEHLAAVRRARAIR